METMEDLRKDNLFVEYFKLYDEFYDKLEGVDFIEGVSITIDYIEKLLNVSFIPRKVFEIDEFVLDAVETLSNIDSNMNMGDKKTTELMMLISILKLKSLGVSDDAILKYNKFEIFY